MQCLRGVCGPGLRCCVVLLLHLCTGVNLGLAERVARVGNDIKASQSGVDVAGTIFLLNDQVLTDGVVYAFRAYFRSDKPIRFQMWHPVGTRPDGRQEFKLVGEIRVIPSVLSTEDVYIEGLLKKCVRVQSGDKLGVFFEESPGAVAYVFDGNSPRAFGYTLANASIPIVKGELLAFDALTFPYDFSVAAYIDTANATDGADEVDCPKGLLIPSSLPELSTTRAPPPTGRPGATGATGPTGSMGATGVRGEQGATGASGHPGSTGGRGSTGPVGSQGDMGATGNTGQYGATGFTGDLGPKGDRGDRGIPGPAGPPGKVIRIYENGTDPSPVTQTEESFLESSLFLLILLIWLGVVSLLIIIILICLCCLLCRGSKRQEKKTPDNTKYYNYTESNRNNLVDRYDSVELDQEEQARKKNGNLTRVDSKPEWMNTMKEDTFQEYSIDTIEREPSMTRLKPHDTSQTVPIPEPDYSVPDYSSPPAYSNGGLSREDLIAY